MNQRDLFDYLSLCVRWIAHDMANPLSAVRAGLDMGEEEGGVMREFVQHGADQLTALTRCLRLIAAPAQDEAQQVQAPEDWFKPLEMFAQGRDIQLSIHLKSLPFLSLAYAGFLAALTLPVIGAVMTGGRIKISRDDKGRFHLEATNLSDKSVQHIKEMLTRQLESTVESTADPADMPFYIARLACQKLGAQIDINTSGQKLDLRIEPPVA